MQQKFLPQVSETLNQLDKEYIVYNQTCENEFKELESDIAQLFKIFFTVQENAKNFLRENIKGESKKFQQRLQTLKARQENFLKSQQKETNIFFSLFSSKDNDEIDSDSLEDFIQKLIEKNEPLNLIRNDCIVLKTELEQLTNSQVSIRNNENYGIIFEEIKENLESTCKEQFRRFKIMFEKSNQEMKKTMFGNSDNNLQINQQQPLKQSQYSNLSNQLSRNQSQQSLKISMVSIDQNQMSRNMKKIDNFPFIANQNVIKAMNQSGPLSLTTENSYFNNQTIHGPFQFEDGGVYQGHMQTQKRHGRGKYLFPDGAFYEGYWKDDIPFGFGRLIRSNGDMYEGMCLNYKAHGKGNFKNLSGDFVYKGEWQDDKKHGHGEEINSGKYEYKGDYKNGLFSGIGQIKFLDGTTFQGNFIDGQITGEGEFKYLNGELYNGQVLNGKKHGKGVFQWSDGRKYEGDYVDDLPDGKGTFYWVDGYSFKGDWSKGQQNGVGIERDPEGNEKEGIWKNGTWVKWVVIE